LIRAVCRQKKYTIAHRSWTDGTFFSVPLLLSQSNHSLQPHVAETRAKHIAALLTLACYRFVSGKPLDSSLPRLGTFTNWGQTLGGILLCAGVPGFLGNLATFYDEADEESAQWEAFLLTWVKYFGAQWIEAARITDLVRKAESATGGLFDSVERVDSAAESALVESLPTDLLVALREKPNSFSIRLGKALEKRIDICYGEDNLRIERRLDKHTKRKEWRVLAGSAGGAPAHSVRETSTGGQNNAPDPPRKKSSGPEHSPHSPPTAKT